MGERKSRLSGKRKVIDGKKLITREELVGIQQPEHATNQRKRTKNAKVSQNMLKHVGSQVMSRKENSMSEDEELDMLDCIAVEM